MSRGLGRVERDILWVVGSQEWRDALPHAATHPSVYRFLPQYSRQSINRAFMRLVEKGYIIVPSYHWLWRCGQLELSPEAQKISDAMVADQRPLLHLTRPEDDKPWGTHRVDKRAAFLSSLRCSQRRGR
jgi:hypothetical protein